MRGSSKSIYNSSGGNLSASEGEDHQNRAEAQDNFLPTIYMPLVVFSEQGPPRALLKEEVGACRMPRSPWHPPFLVPPLLLLSTPSSILTSPPALPRSAPNPPLSIPDPVLGIP